MKNEAEYRMCLLPKERKTGREENAGQKCNESMHLSSMFVQLSRMLVLKHLIMI